MGARLSPAQVLKTAREARDCSTEELDKAEKIHGLSVRSEATQAILDAWVQQEKDERALRKEYAGKILRLFWAQTLLINLAVLGLGRQWLHLDSGNFKALILAVFGELAALILVVARYLFPAHRRDLGDLLKRLARNPE